jgi:hypothetical protein
MIAPVFDKIPAYEQAFSPNLLFFQRPLKIVRWQTLANANDRMSF